eukprot:Em0397g4a
MEDVEFLECQEEMNEQVLEQYTLVERVIAARTGDGQSQQEYFCKWRGLPYSECTWEDSSPRTDRFLEQIDSFLCRNQAETIPRKSAKVYCKGQASVHLKPTGRDIFPQVLVEIGDHIQECIKSYGDGVMRSNLWLFVSKFTPSQPQKLYKIYKKARKERGKEDMPVKRHYLESSEQGSMEAYGGWGQEAVSMFARLSILLSLHQRQSFSAALNELYCHLSVVLMRQNAQVLLAHAAGAR